MTIIIISACLMTGNVLCSIEATMQEAVEELQQLYQLPGDEAQRVLREEIVALEEQVGQQEKRAAQVSDWMYQDAQVCLLMTADATGTIQIHLHRSYCRCLVFRIL